MKTTILCILSVSLYYNVWAQDPTSSASDPLLSVAAGNTQFALELLQATSGDVGKFMNIGISPFSIWAVLALIREGSGGKTNTQLQNALHLRESNKDIRTAYRKLHHDIQVVSNGVEMVSTSALFTDKNRPLQWEFEYLAEKVYKSNIFPVDFADTSATVNSINRWVSNATHNRITQLVHEEDMVDPHLVIANGMFFKGKWMKPFNTSYTFADKFYDDHDRVLGEVQMMHKEDHFRFSYLDDLEAQVLELPYEGEKFSMMVVVPSRGTTINDVLDRLSKTPLERIYQRMTEEEEEFPDDLVEVHLPRVVINSDIILNKALEKLGIIDLFNDAKADLSAMSPNSIYLHKMIHKAEIVVDEEGTVASSSTAGVMTYRHPMPKIHANRPFAFFIVERSMKIIVFAAKVVNPHM